MRSQIAVQARRVRSELSRRARKLAALGGINLNRAPRDLRGLNGKMSSRAKRDPAIWVADALQFALNYECYETAERLARFAQANWPQLTLERRRQLIAPVAETLIVIGEKDEARALLDTQRRFFRDDDRIMGLYAVLGDAPQPALLPSGKLNAFALSSSAADRRAELRKLYEEKPNLFAHDVQNYLLLCNAAIGTSEENYREFLNKFLAHHKVGEVASVDFSKNILDGIAFRREASISEGPRVSIIMSAYNAAATIGYAIRSILDQQYTNIELLICDDASDDTTMSTVRAATGSDVRVRLFRSRSSQGPYNIRNALIPETSGEYVTFHDADDLALPSRIGLQLKNLTGKKITADIGRYIRMRPSGEIVFFRDRSALRNCLVSIMAPKDAFLRYGPYRSVRFGGDTQFKERIRLAEGDAAVQQLPEPVMFCLWSANSLTQSGGSESFEDGYRGPKRRRIAEITTRQRLLGNAIVPEDEIARVLQDEQIFVEPAGIETVDQNS